MDGFTLSFLEKELRKALVGGRVDKVGQPDRDTLVLTIRSQGENHKLILCANASQARIQLTTQNFENPPEPPMFCMLMRKHLSGSRVIGLRQIGGDRVIALEFEGMGELGDIVPKTLYLEIMGRHSNLILVDEKGIIGDSIKHVNSEMSRVRTVLPGQRYQLPPGQDKLSPETMTAKELETRLSLLPMPLFKGLMACVAGMANVCAKEVCAQLGLSPEADCRELQWDILAPGLVAFFQGLGERFAPVLLTDEFGGALDFFPFPYLNFAEDRQRRVKTLSLAMDGFYLERDQRLRMQQRGAGLQKHVKTALERLEKKRGILQEVLEGSEKTEQYRIFGELLTANLHQLTPGQDQVSLPNYYDPDMAQVTIPLSPQHSPVHNAQKYYTKYRKAKVAAEYAVGQLEKATREWEFLEGALEDLDKCESSADLAEIRYVLAENGYLRPEPAQRKQKKMQEGKPYRFVSGDGTEILVGRNSLQNDRLTLRARGEELWLHAQGIPGSHVLVRTEQEPSKETLLQAAKLATYFSKGRNHPAQPVDYVKRKYVKKAAGAPAGFVTYTHFQTLLVGLTPEDMAAIARESVTKG